MIGAIGLRIRDGEVDTDVIADYEATRRQVVGRGLVAGAGVLSATGIPLLLGVGDAFAGSGGDAHILERAVALEQTAVVAYRAAARSGKLGSATRVARLFAAQEQEHADALERALAGLGGKAPPKPESARDVPGLEKAAAGNARELLTFAVELETMAVKAYYEAQAKLRDPKLISTSAAIMADEAQHLVVLRQALGHNPSPDAFVTGGAA